MRVAAKSRALRGLLCGLLVIAVGGCAVATDMLDPGLLVQLGVDPATVTRPQGVVIVALNNMTLSSATFYAYHSQGAGSPQARSKGSRNFSVLVESGEARNEVIECPVGEISPGSLDAGFDPESLAAVVHTVDGDVNVDYGGIPLEISKSFSCGDVIEIRLVPLTTGDDTDYRIVVRVIP